MNSFRRVWWVRKCDSLKKEKKKNSVWSLRCIIRTQTLTPSKPPSFFYTYIRKEAPGVPSELSKSWPHLNTFVLGNSNPERFALACLRNSNATTFVLYYEK